MQEMENLNVGVTGLGAMGSKHALDILNDEVPGLRLTAVADAVPGRASEFARDWDGLEAFEDTRAMIHSGKIGGLIIATPHFSHTELGILALEAGLHVMVEKPVSVHKADCLALEAAYKKVGNRVFAAMFNMRTDPKFCKIKQLIDSGALGRINRVSWIVTDWFRTEAYYQSGDWRATWAGEGGGVLLNQCPHQLDLWQWFFGMPGKVRAFCRFGQYHDIEVEDDVTAYLEYENGMTGTFITTTGEAPGTNRLEIAAEQGRLLLENNRLQFIRNEVPTSIHSREKASKFKRPDTWVADIPFSENPRQHQDTLANFAQACLRGTPLVAPAVEGTHSVELGNAMLLSTWEDCTVDLPLDAEHFSALLQKHIESSRFQPSTSSP